MNERHTTMKKILLFIMTLAAVAPAMAQRSVSLDTIDTKTQLRWAYRYKNGINADVSLKNAAKIYMHLARQGNIDGMRELGRMYLYGQGVECNRRYAGRLLKRAAECGDAKAMCLLAQMYQQALGFKQNYEKAFYWYNMAAKKGSGRGWYGAGYMLYKGLGVKQDYALAEKYLLRGSERGNQSCDFLLGGYYMNGYGGSPDYTKAAKHLDRAVKEGHGWTLDMTKYGVMDSIKNARARRAAMPMMMAASTAPRTLAAVDSLLAELPADTLAGGWTGTVYTCDWSGKEILAEEPITIDITPQDTLLTAAWTWGEGDGGDFTPTERRGASWRITRLGDNEEGRRWVITSMTFGLADANTLCARLRCMNVKHYEKRKPVFAVLRRNEPVTPQRYVPFRIMQVAPMPVTNGQFTVTLQANESCTVSASIYSASGMKAADCGIMHIDEGENYLQLNAALTPGQYVLRITGAKGSASTQIICR